MDFKTSFKKERHHIYLTVVLAIFSFIYFIDSIVYFSDNFFYLFVFAVLFLGADVFIIKRHQKKLTTIVGIENINEEEIHRLFDRYTRRFVNWLLIAFLKVFVMILDFVSLSVNSKVDEIMEFFNGNLSSLEIVAFFLAKTF